MDSAETRLRDKARDLPWRARIAIEDLRVCGDTADAFLANVLQRKLSCRAGTLVDGSYRFVAAEEDRVRAAASTPGTWLRVDHLERVWPEVERAYRRICASMGMPPGTGVSGFVHGPAMHVPRHVDSTAGLVFHVEGGRKWRLEPPERPGEGEFDELRPVSWTARAGPRSQSLNVRQGEWLFVPRGWWHETRSERTSLALRLSLAVPLSV